MTTNIHDHLTALGLRVVTYTNKATLPDDDGRIFWLPRDCVGTDGKAGIFWRMADAGRRDVSGATYRIDGWEPWADLPHCGTSFGGRYDRFEAALAWLEHYAAHRLQRQEQPA